MNVHANPGQVRRLQDDFDARPTPVTEYAISTLAQSTSVDNMINLMLQMWEFPNKYHEPRNKKPEPIEETDAYVRYAQQMAYQGIEVWNE